RGQIGVELEIAFCHPIDQRSRWTIRHEVPGKFQRKMLRGRRLAGKEFQNLLALLETARSKGSAHHPTQTRLVRILAEHERGLRLTAIREIARQRNAPAS